MTDPLPKDELPDDHPYKRFIFATREEAINHALRGLKTVAPVSPDKVGEALKVQEQSLPGTPALELAQDPELGQQSEDERIMQILRERPSMVQYLKVPENAALSQDELETLREYDPLLRTQQDPEAVEAETGDFERGFEKGKLTYKTNWAGRVAALTEGFRSNLEQMQTELEVARAAVMSGQPLGEGEFSPRTAYYASLSLEEIDQLESEFYEKELGTEKFAEVLRETIMGYTAQQQALGQGVQFTDVDSFGDFIDFLQENTGMILPSAAESVIAGMVGGPALVAASGYSSGVGEITSSAIIDGVDIRSEEFKQRRRWGAMAYGALDTLGLGKVGGKVVNNLLGAAEESFSKAVTRWMAETGQTSLEEGTAEVLQSIMATWAVEGRPLSEITTEDWEGKLNEFAAGFFGGGVVGGATTAPTVAVEVARGRKEAAARKAEVESASIEKLNELAAKTKTRDRSEKKFREFLQSQPQDRATLYLDADAILAFASENPGTPQLLGLTRPQIEQAAEAGTPLAVNTADYLSRVPGRNPQLAALVAENGRFSPDGLTGAEAKKIAEDVQEAATAAKKVATEAEARQMARQEAVKVTTDQLVAAGMSRRQARQQAEVQGAFLNTMAETFGDDAIFGMFDIAVAGPGTARPQGGRVLDQRNPDLAEDTIMGPDGEPVRLYHGTSEQFTGFAGNRLFFTNQPGLATQHAIRGGVKPTSRVIEGRAALAKPIEIAIPGDQEPDAYYLQNAEAIEARLEAGEGDSVMIYNEEGNLLVIATANEQISQLDKESGEFRVFNQSGVPLFDTPLEIDGKVTVKAIGEAMTQDHMDKYGRKLLPEDSEEDYQEVLRVVTEELANQLARPNSGAGWYSKDVELAINQTAKVLPGVATPEGRSVFLTFAGIFSNGLDPSQAWEISAEAFEYWEKFGEIPINRSEAAKRLGKEVRMTTYKKDGETITKPAGWGVRNPANEQQLTMFKNLVEREGGPVEAVNWMLSEQTPDAINEIVLTAQNSPRFKTKAEREGPNQWGALMFSEKLGRYTMGLHGFEISEADTTVDLWYTRTYRRLTGRLLDKPIGKEGVAAQPDPARGGIERKTIFRMTGDLSRAFGDLPAGDVQAMLWFFEKRLWGAQGLRTDEGTNSAGARRLLEKRGVDFDDGTGSAAADQGTGAEAARTFQQQARGQIAIPEGGVLSGRTIIELTKSADLSTYLHESGHFFLEAFQALAARADAPDRVTADMRRINTWLGRDEGDTSVFTTAQQEKWAEAFETYLMEGRAPSRTLKAAFARFKRWLTYIYKRAAVGGEISDDIRGVFDRLLATDAEIEAVKAEFGDTLLFADGPPPGMSAAEYEVYKTEAERADAEFEGRVLNAAMAKVRRKRQKEYSKAVKKAVAEVTEELQQRKEYQLIRRLGGMDEQKGAQLNKQAVVDSFGTAALGDLSSKRHGVSRNLYGDGGVDPAIIAETYGFSNESAMFNALRSTPELKAEAQRLAEEQVDAEIGVDVSEAAIRAEAIAALKSASKNEIVAREAAALRKAAGPREKRTGPTRWQLQNARAKEQAQKIVEDMTVREIMNYNAFLRQSYKHARAAQRELAKVVQQGQRPTGKAMAALEAAAEAKERQLVADHAFRIARDLAERVEKKRSQYRKLSKESVQKGIGPEFMDAIETIIDRYDFRKLGPKAVKKSVDVMEFYQQLMDGAFAGQLDSDPKVIMGINAKHYSLLKGAEIEAMIDTVDNLIHMGRSATQLRYQEKQFDLNLIFDDIADRVGKNVRGEGPGRSPSERKKSRWAIGIRHALVNADAMADEYDHGQLKGRKDIGPMGRYVKLLVDRALDRLDIRRIEAAKDINKLFAQLGGKKGMRKLFKESKVYAELNGDRLTKMDLIMFALNGGNESNWERIVEYDKVALSRVLARELTEAEWRFVQDTLDYINSFWPEIDKNYRELTGLRAEKVTALPMIEGAPDFFTGGYFPVRYDKEMDGATEDQNRAALVMEGKSASFLKAQTQRNHTKKRMAGPNKDKRIALDPGIIENHIFSVIHDLEMGPAVHEAGKIVYGQQFATILRDVGRAEDTAYWKAWLEDIAVGEHRMMMHTGAKWLRLIRSSVSMQAMGFNLSSALAQTTGVINNLITLGPRHTVVGFRHAITRGSRFVTDASPMMQERIRTFNRDVNELTETTQSALPSKNIVGEKLTKLRQIMMPISIFALQQMQFRFVDVPLWLGRYNQALTDGATMEDAAALADKAVRQFQGSGRLSDRSMLERGRLGPDSDPNVAVTLGTPLYSYMNAMANLTYLLYRQAGKGRANRDPYLIGSAVGAFMMLIYVNEIAFMLFKQGLPEDDEEAQDMLIGVALAPVNLVPFAREIPGYLRYGDARGAVGTTLEALVDATTAGVDIATGEEEVVDVWPDIGKGIAVGLGLPLTQAIKVLEDFIEGETDEVIRRTLGGAVVDLTQ